LATAFVLLGIFPTAIALAGGICAGVIAALAISIWLEPWLKKQLDRLVFGWTRRAARRAGERSIAKV
jgi:hypothetical protein